MSNIVSLVKANSSEELRLTVSRATDLISFKPGGSVKSVVIKPNLCYYWDSSTGYTTNPRLVAGIIDWVRERFGDVDIKVAEADASAMRTKHAFPALGYDKMAQEKKVELFNLSSDLLLDETVRVNGHDITFKVPPLLKKSELFINVPKLKIMRAVTITCAMKNIFGCIGHPRKVIYHKFLHEAIVGINKILRPHLTIVDGLVGLGTRPTKLDLVMASTNVVSVDWIASKIMGYKPSSVKFLKLAVKEKLGDPHDITTAGEDVSDFAKAFPKEGFVATKYLWGMQFWMLNAYRKVSGDIVPPFIDEG